MKGMSYEFVATNHPFIATKPLLVATKVGGSQGQRYGFAVMCGPAFFSVDPRFSQFAWSTRLWTRVFRSTCASPLDGRDSLFVVLLENHFKKKKPFFKKRFGVATYFCFYFKREKQNKKEKP